MSEKIQAKAKLPNLDKFIQSVYSSVEYQRHKRLLSQYIDYCAYTSSPFTVKGFEEWRAKVTG